MEPFWERAISSCLGSFFGFLFAIVLFLITTFIQNRNKKNGALQLLRWEMRLNLSLLEKWLAEINDIEKRVIAGDTLVYFTPRYQDFSSVFLADAFKGGSLLNYYTEEDWTEMVDAFRHFVPGTAQFLSDKIEVWRQTPTDTKDAIGTLQFEKGNISKYQKVLRRMTEKLPKSKVAT